MAENNKSNYQYFYFSVGNNTLIAKLSPMRGTFYHTSWVDVSHLKDDPQLADMLYPSLGGLLLLWESLDADGCNGSIKIMKDYMAWWDNEGGVWKSFKFKMGKGACI